MSFCLNNFVWFYTFAESSKGYNTQKYLYHGEKINTSLRFVILMSSEDDAKRIILLIFGIVFLFTTLLFVLASLVYAFHLVGSVSPEESNQYAIFLFTLCTAPVLIITVVIFYFYFKISRRVAIEEDIMGALKLYRKIKLSTLAQQIGLPPNKTEKYLLKLIDENRINAYLDRDTMEIIVYDNPYDVRVENITCPNCGAKISGVYVVGEIVRCKYCGTVFKIEK